MIEWNELSRIGWKSSIPALGKRMQSWVSKDTWDILSRSIAHLNEKDSWSALETTMALFRKLTHETARELGYSYPGDIDGNISKFINKLRGH